MLRWCFANGPESPQYPQDRSLDAGKQRESSAKFNRKIIKLYIEQMTRMQSPER